MLSSRVENIIALSLCFTYTTDASVGTRNRSPQPVHPILNTKKKCSARPILGIMTRAFAKFPSLSGCRTYSTVISGTRVSRDSCVRADAKARFPGRESWCLMTSGAGIRRRGPGRGRGAVVRAGGPGLPDEKAEDGGWRIDLVSRTRVTQIPFLRSITRVAILNSASYRQVQECHIIAT